MTTADRFAANVAPIIRNIERAGVTTLQGIADALNARGIRTARGRRWYATTVKNVLDRARPRYATCSAPPIDFNSRHILPPKPEFEDLVGTLTQAEIRSS